MYVGPCPFCADGGDDRFHVWMEASAGRPAERYWCRVCNQSGLLKHLDCEEQRGVASSTREPKRPQAFRPHVAPDPAHIPFYRQLYQAVALWAHSWLLDPCHPAPRAYLHQRGLSDKIIGHYVLGVTLSDPESLVAYLRETCPEAFPYVELGATFPFGWDTIRPQTQTVIIAEAEFKALAALQAFHAGALPYPTLGQPGLTLFREAWAEHLAAQGVEEVVLCYDSQPRTVKDGVVVLAPEEQWSLRHGLTCAAARLRVRVSSRLVPMPSALAPPPSSALTTLAATRPVGERPHPPNWMLSWPGRYARMKPYVLVVGPATIAKPSQGR